MKLVEINLATRPFRNNSLIWAGFGTVGVALLLLSGLNAWLFLGYGTTAEQHRSDLVVKGQKRSRLSLQEQQISARLSGLDFKGLAGKAEFANDAIRRRAFSWTELFNRLEEVVPPTVMMTSIRPEIQADGISVVVEGVAKDHEGLLDFEANLIVNSYFAKIYPGSERREQRERELHFSLKFNYVPGGRPGTVTPDPEKAKDPEKKPDAHAGAKDSTVPAAAGAIPGSGAPSPPIPQPTAAVRPGAAGVAPPQTGAPVAGSPPATPVPSAADGGLPSAASGPNPPSTTAGATSVQNSARFPAGPLKRFAGPRGLLRPGGGGFRGGPGGSPGPPMRADGPLARRRGQEPPPARFQEVPVQTVLDYLMKYRSMTFVMGGDFDLRKKVSVDLTGKEDGDVLVDISRLLDCFVANESEGIYRLTPKSGGEVLEEPPVEEEPVPPEEATGQEDGMKEDEGAPEEEKKEEEGSTPEEEKP